MTRTPPVFTCQAELELRSVVLTIDGDFKRYRRNRRHVVPAIMPR